MDAQRILNHLVAFEATARLGSFRAAADELCVTQGAVAQQVRAMEHKLGVVLFERLPRGLRPTPAAQVYLERVRLALGIVDEATRELCRTLEDDAPGRLTLSTTPAFASRWLIPRLGQLAEAEPGVSVMIDASDQVRPLQGPGAVDLAIRWGTPPFGSLKAEFLADGRAVAVCSPRLLARWTHPADLLGVPLISDTHDNWTRWFEHYGVAAAKVQGPVFSQTSLALEAAERGMGIALVPQVLVQDALRNGTLVEVLEGGYPLDSGAGFYLVTGSTASPLADRVGRWLASQMA